MAESHWTEASAMQYKGYDDASEVRDEGTSCPKSNLPSPRVCGVKSIMAGDERQPSEAPQMICLVPVLGRLPTPHGIPTLKSMLKLTYPTTD